MEANKSCRLDILERLRAYGDRLVGKLDATTDRDSRVFQVHAVHQDVPFTRTMSRAVDHEIEDLAGWLQLPLVR